jgi:hypothetical protein
VEDIASSEYLVRHHKIDRSPAPFFDLDEEKRLHTMLLILIRKGLINAAHDVSDGGLWTTLVEMALPRGLGFDIVTDSEVREDAFLFGEGTGPCRGNGERGQRDRVPGPDAGQPRALPAPGPRDQGQIRGGRCPLSAPSRKPARCTKEAIPKIMNEQ